MALPCEKFLVDDLEEVLMYLRMWTLVLTDKSLFINPLQIRANTSELAVVNLIHSNL